MTSTTQTAVVGDLVLMRTPHGVHLGTVKAVERGSATMWHETTHPKTLVIRIDAYMGYAGHVVVSQDAIDVDRAVRTQHRRRNEAGQLGQPFSSMDEALSAIDPYRR